MTPLKNKEIKRGRVYWVNLDPTIGSEIKKTRPAVVISNNLQNKVSSRVIVIPITSSVEKIYPFEAKLKLSNNTQSKALTDQIRAVDKMRIGDCLCVLEKEEMKEIDKALKITLSLD
jgi:mRNA interferase MazF